MSEMGETIKFCQCAVDGAGTAWLLVIPLFPEDVPEHAI
jgi:hypothetical protein